MLYAAIESLVLDCGGIINRSYCLQEEKIPTIICGFVVLLDCTHFSREAQGLCYLCQNFHFVVLEHKLQFEYLHIWMFSGLLSWWFPFSFFFFFSVPRHVKLPLAACFLFLSFAAACQLYFFFIQDSHVSFIKAHQWVIIGCFAA